MAGSYEEDEGLYEIEKILSCRVATDGKISYLVRWKDYNSDDDTWEPEDNVLGCKAAVLDFFKERDVKPKQKNDYMILHLKDPSPDHSSSWIKNENIDNKADNIKQRKRGGRPPGKSICKDHSLMHINRRLTPERKCRLAYAEDSPVHGKHRATPKRRSRLLYDVEQSSGNQRDDESLSPPQLPQSEVKRRSSTTTGKRLARRSRERSRSSSRNRAEQEPITRSANNEVQPITSKSHYDEIVKQLCFLFSVSAALSFSLIGIGYAILVYDLS